MTSKLLYFFIICFFTCLTYSLWTPNVYKMGDSLMFQCWDGHEYKNLICENGNMTISYGNDGFTTCRWNPTKWGYEEPRKYVLDNVPLSCRLQNIHNTEIYTTFYIRFIGKEDYSHLYVYSYYFLSLHTEKGQILSIGFYPAQKNLHLVRSDGDIYLQISIKWFKSLSYSPFIEEEVNHFENNWKTWEISIKFIVILIILFAIGFWIYQTYKKKQMRRDNLFHKWE